MCFVGGTSGCLHNNICCKRPCGGKLSLCDPKCCHHFATRAQISKLFQQKMKYIFGTEHPFYFLELENSIGMAHDRFESHQAVRCVKYLLDIGRKLMLKDIKS